MIKTKKTLIIDGKDINIIYPLNDMIKIQSALRKVRTEKDLNKIKSITIEGQQKAIQQEPDQKKKRSQQNRKKYEK